MSCVFIFSCFLFILRATLANRWIHVRRMQARDAATIRDLMRRLQEESYKVQQLEVC